MRRARRLVLVRVILPSGPFQQLSIRSSRQTGEGAEQQHEQHNEKYKHLNIEGLGRGKYNKSMQAWIGKGKP